ncbi:hypothetical protein WA026_014191 [Henosepilachna vigintioctopunctata]|uniref:Uncharacterized protein n=1 Tax=Henosepilachna vigintioctopunctata TaxID=420089 RepID=A0AAW1TSS6_9CUCU
MSRLQFDVELAADEDPKNNIIIIKSITKENGITYLIPPCFQAAKHHLQLLKLPEFLKIKKSLQRRGQNRKVWMSVPSDVLALYEDDVGNMTFNDYLLQEITQVTSQSITDGKLLEILEKIRLPTYITSKLDRQEVADPILLFSALRYKKLDIPPLIEVEVILNDKLKCTGIYDPGSNITLINSKLIKVTNSKENYFENKFNTIGGGGKTTGLIRLNGKILTIEKEINAFICNDKNFTHDLILGLDTIKRFGLTHDGNLNIQLQENANPGENKYISPNEKKNLIIKKLRQERLSQKYSIMK